MNGRGMQTCNLLNDTIDVWAVSEPLGVVAAVLGKGMHCVRGQEVEVLVYVYFGMLKQIPF